MEPPHLEEDSRRLAVDSHSIKDTGASVYCMIFPVSDVLVISGRSQRVQNSQSDFVRGDGVRLLHRQVED